MHFITYNKRLLTMCTFSNYILVVEYYKFTSYIFMRKNIN